MMAECLVNVWTICYFIPFVEGASAAAVPGYLDPGTGSLIIQMLIGTLVGGVVAARLFWKRGAERVKSLFRSGPGNDTPEN